ncbi:hypothetical protein D9M68_569660 [compost metagenome]
MRLDAGQRVAGQHAEVDGGLGAAGQHVVLVAGAHDGQRRGRAQHGVAARALLELAAHQRLGEPQVRQHDAVDAAHLGRERTEHLAGHALDAAGHRRCFEPRERGAHAADGAFLRRHRRVAGGGVERQEESAVALLGQADERRRLAQAGQHAVEHQQAFVEHPIEAHVARLEQFGDGQRAAQAAHFFVVAHHQVNGLLRLEAGADEKLDGFHLREKIALVVERAAAPDETVLDLAGEGVDRPGFFSAGGDGHHVLVRHQRDGLGGRIGAGPCVEQRLVAHDFLLQGGVDLGVLLFEVGVELVELGRVGGRVVHARHRAERDRRRQPFGGCLQVDVQLGCGRHRKLLRWRGPGLDRHGRHQCQEHQQQPEEDAFQHGRS